ncbi:MAG: hypothetical protein IJ058_06325 [Lachnospiraceae bacterium]|nr:hypothetical protein [Lachnospiraceae bacterium]
MNRAMPGIISTVFIGDVKNLLGSMIANIDLGMIIRIGLAIVIIVMLIRFSFTDNLLRRNLKPFARRLIVLIGVIAVIILMLGALGSLKSRGEGTLFTDMSSYGNQILTGDTDTGDAVLEITIRGNSVTLDKKEYENIGSSDQAAGQAGSRTQTGRDDLANLITNAVGNGSRIVIIDDYAARSTYEEVISMAENAGYDPQNIEYVKF